MLFMLFPQYKFLARREFLVFKIINIDYRITALIHYYLL